MAYLDGIKRVEDLDLDGKRVFVRVDFNVPLDNGVITDDFRIRQAIPTIQYIIRNGGLPVVASHLGRPKANPSPEFSLKPVAERLSELLPEREVIFAEDCIGDGVVEQSKRLEPGQILLLENLRFYEEEEGKPRGKFNSDEEKAAAKKALKESQKKFAESLAASTMHLARVTVRMRRWRRWCRSLAKTRVAVICSKKKSNSWAISSTIPSIRLLQSWAVRR